MNSGHWIKRPRTGVSGQKNEVRLYNMILPLWALWLFPQAWLVILPGNFLIDSLVLLIAMKCVKLEGIGGRYAKSILKVWLLGFAADFIGVGMLILPVLLDSLIPSPGVAFIRSLVSVMENPFANAFSLIYTLFAIGLSGLCIYGLNRKFSFNNTEMDDGAKGRLSLCLAVFTAPYLFLLPSSLIN